jgi:hypothetical protein
MIGVEKKNYFATRRRGNMKRPGRKTLAQKQAESAASGLTVIKKDKSKYRPVELDSLSQPPEPETFEYKPFYKLQNHG